MQDAPRGFRLLLGDERWHRLVRQGSTLTFAPQAYLLRQGEIGDGLLLLVGGRVKVLAQDADGAELLISLRGPGDLVGEMAAPDTAERSAAVQAIDRCTACSVGMPTFRRFLADAAAHEAFADYLLGRLAETAPYTLRMVRSPPLRRVALLCKEITDLAAPDDPQRLRIPLSQEAIAGALSLARSTVAAQLAALRRAGALARGPRLVVRDPLLLSQFAYER